MADSSIPDSSFLAALRGRLPQVLPEFLMRRRWFGGKARRIHVVEVSDVVPVCREAYGGYLVLVRVEYDTGPGDT